MCLPLLVIVLVAFLLSVLNALILSWIGLDFKGYLAVPLCVMGAFVELLVFAGLNTLCRALIRGAVRGEGISVMIGRIRFRPKKTEDLTNAEKAIFATVIGACTDERFSKVLQTQVNRTSCVFRHRTEKGYTAHSEETYHEQRFFNPTQFEIACLEAWSEGRRFDVQIIALHGCWGLFHLNGPIPNDVRTLQLEQIKVVRLNEWYGEAPKLRGWVKALADKGVISRFASPADPETLAEREDLIADCPKDYVELIRQTNGVSLGEYAIVDIDEVTEIPLTDGRTSVVLVDLLDEGMIGIIRGERTGELYHFTDETYPGAPFASSLREAIQRLLAQADEAAEGTEG